MRLVLDLQACQTASGKRGIGRYSLMLAQALARRAGEDEVRVTLSGDAPEEPDAIISAFDGLLPPERFYTFHTAPGAFDASGALDAMRVRSALYRHHVASLSPDAVHVSSMFAGTEGDWTFTPHDLDRLAPTLTGSTVYDLIPLIYPDRYLMGSATERTHAIYSEYGRHDVLAAISESTRTDLIERLGVAPDRVRAIGADVDPVFRCLADPMVEAGPVLALHGIEGRFILYTGGDDFRKNIKTLIEAFSRLPADLQRDHQLVIVCRVSDERLKSWKALAQRCGVADRMVVTGFVPDDDLVALYNACTLFVFPSLYEGFGLPVLEAMRCGAPVIGSRTSSIPEVIGRDDALFDPTDPYAIAEAMARSLTDDTFRHALAMSGAERARRFSWDRSADILWDAYREGHERRTTELAAAWNSSIVMASPFPPARSGIASYAADFVSAVGDDVSMTMLDHEFRPLDDDRVEPESSGVDEWDARSAPERVLHMGNSDYHYRMWDRMLEGGGITVLHDFFLSGMLNALDHEPGRSGLFDAQLARSHPEAVGDADRGRVIYRYPINRGLIEATDGVFVHSRYAERLRDQFYPDLAGTRFAYMPQVRTPLERPSEAERAATRETLGIPRDAIVVLTAGFIQATKYSDEVLKAFSALADRRDDVRFVFLGEGKKGFMSEVRALADRADNAITVTGFVDDARYLSVFAIADIVVQLRRHSRGETSRAVLDAMALGLPTIVNDYAQFAEIADDAVLKIAEEPDVDDIVRAVEHLADDGKLRGELGCRARETIVRENSPEAVSRAFRYGLARFEADIEQRGLRRRLDEVLKVSLPLADRVDYDGVARALIACGKPALAGGRLDRTFGGIGDAVEASQKPMRLEDGEPRLLVDVTYTDENDLNTGIQRVVRRTVEGAQVPREPSDTAKREVVPVSFAESRPRIAEGFVIGSDHASNQRDVHGRFGDTLLMLDSSWAIYPDLTEHFADVRGRGGRVVTTVYDLVPLLHPEVTDEAMSRMFDRWLRVALVESDALVCISRAVADEVIAYVRKHNLPHRDGLRIGWWHMGSDLARVAEAKPRSELAAFLDGEAAVFLMVGTVEPRKRHRVVLDAMEKLWAEGSDARLLLIGKQGWRIEEIAERLRGHPEMGRRLLWIEDGSDSDIAHSYDRATALVFASVYEGFGLPIVEAARAGLGSIASDIPVLREVGGEGALYFPVDDADALAALMGRVERGDAQPDPTRTVALSWDESVRQLLDMLYDDRWYAMLRADDRRVPD